ncbi:gamma-glutamyltransferase [SAR202 cluster bacterium AD-804-J14_MRT_500m]|nr:gamma-glutamyltransferase [SAR202 cluster bacterium AD-804-J14_MRT_500m]
MHRPTYLSKSSLPQGGVLRAHRPVVKSRKGMVACAHYAASMAGAQMFFKGGNAVDAVIAAAAALNVVEPYMSGLGGVGFLVISRNYGEYREVLNFSGVVPQKAVPAAFTPGSHSVGVRCPIVPGNPAGWLAVLQAYGTLQGSDVLGPAIDLAEDGYVVSELDGRFFEVNFEKLSKFDSSRRAFGKGERPVSESEILVQKNLASTFRSLASQGVGGFYTGEVATEIDRFMRASDGLITESDLESYHPKWQEPIASTYKGYEIVTTGPNSNAFQILQTLNILEESGVDGLEHNSAEYIHLVSEAIKLAVTDRIIYGGDPDFVDVPVTGLISKDYALSQKKRIDRNSASVVMGERFTSDPSSGSLQAGSPTGFKSGETTHLSAADGQGTVVTITQTLGSAFGSGVVAGSTGVLLNNLIDLMDIDPKSDSRLLLAPGKRPGSNMAPVQVFKDGKFVLSIGTPGSYGIPQTTAQMLLNVLEFGMNVQEAIEAPRFRVMGGVRINMEDRISTKVRESLESRGHDVNTLGEWTTEVGGGHAIALDPDTGVLMGGADPRRDGYALGV